MLEVSPENIPDSIRVSMSDFFIEMITMLGVRTAELHISLASISDNKDFTPETFSILYQRSIYQSIQTLTNKTLDMLKKKTHLLPKVNGPVKDFILQKKSKVLKKIQTILKSKFSMNKIRIHGDFHLGQILFTGKDFIIIDFEGEPARSFSERRLKNSSFKDIAGILRSFHYAAYSAIHLKSTIRSQDAQLLESWIKIWYHYTSGIFLNAYLKTSEKSSFISKDKDEINNLLKVYLLEKAMYELSYELNNRPKWVSIPLKGIEDIFKEY